MTVWQVRPFASCLKVGVQWTQVRYIAIVNENIQMVPNSLKFILVVLSFFTVSVKYFFFSIMCHSCMRQIVNVNAYICCINLILCCTDNVLECSCMLWVSVCRSTLCDVQTHMDMIYRLTLKLGMVRGLVGDGVEDLVDFGVEIWLLETPFTIWRKTGKEVNKIRGRSHSNCKHSC